MAEGAAASAAPKAQATGVKAAPAAKQATAANTQTAQAISQEEPFVKGDFSADAGVQAQEALEELKDLFSVIPGELMA